MKDFKKTKLIALISVIGIVILLVVLGLYFHPITELKKLDSKQVESVGFVGEGENIVYDYPEDAAKELIEILKSAKLKDFSTKKYEDITGGGPTIPTAIIFEDDSRIKISYKHTRDKSFLIINGKGYLCDRKTIDEVEKINRECYDEYRATW